MTRRSTPRLAMTLLAAGCLVQSSAVAGANSATLKCTPAASEHRRVFLEGDVPADIEELNLTIMLGSASSKLDNSNADAYTVEHFDRRVYTLTIWRRDTHDTTTLYADPASVMRKNIPNGIVVKFFGYLDTPKPVLPGPAQLADDRLRSVRLSCTYRYEI